MGPRPHFSPTRPAGGPAVRATKGCPSGARCGSVRRCPVPDLYVSDPALVIFSRGGMAGFSPGCFEAVPVGTLKKYATGFAGADKEAMAKWLYRRFPKERTLGLDDNAIDAVWLYKWAEQHLGRMKV